MKMAFMKFNQFLMESMGEKEYTKFMEDHKTEFVKWVNEQHPDLPKKELLEIARIKKVGSIIGKPRFSIRVQVVFFRNVPE